MCGIAGFVARRDACPKPGTLERMLARLARRGPDGQGAWTATWGDWSVFLGHRRLSILDRSGGAQPMASASRVSAITFNGEIYNFAELRSRLVSRGVAMRTRSDTEVLVNHLELGGERAVEDLNGMFAYAHWNQSSGELTLARDRAGVKPLYYRGLAGGGIAFASELTALLEIPEVGIEVSREDCAAYFFSDYVHSPRSILRSAAKICPGEELRWREGVLAAPRRYWILPEVDSTRAREDPGELGEELWRKLRVAVRRQLVADVPVGVFLSGGIDSSCIAKLATEESQGPIRTFAIAFEDPEYDESGHARAVAELLGSVHTTRMVRRESLLEAIGPALDCLDEPLGDHSIVPTYLLAELARETVKVALGGDGGDELWGGYPTYEAHALADVYGRLPAVATARAIPFLARAIRPGDGYQSLAWKTKRFVDRWEVDSSRRHLRWMAATDLPGLQELFPRDGPRDQPEPLVLKERASEGLTSFLALDFRTYLPGSVLAKVDRATMSNGLEARPPFLDNELIDWSFRRGDQWKVRAGVTKRLLKIAAKGRIPEAILDRRKHGFSVPLADWVRGRLDPRIRDILSESPVWELGEGAPSRQVLARWRDEHAERRADRSKPLWSLLVLDHWLRRARGIRAESAQP